MTTKRFQAISLPDYHAQRQRLRFPPPMAGHALDPAGADFAWRMLQYCFGFPDPRSAKPSNVQLQPDDSVVVARFVTKAVSLAASPFLAHPTGMTVDVSDDGRKETVTTRFPHEESERGFLTLLRQFAHDGEPASYKTVQSLAVRDDSERGSPNGELLRGWGKYHKKLLNRTPETWAYIKAYPPGTPLTQIPGGAAPRVDQLLRTYYYGDVIHFGEGRDELEALSQDTFSSAYNRMDLFAGAAGLARFYMGYAEIVGTVYDLHDLLSEQR